MKKTVGLLAAIASVGILNDVQALTSLKQKLSETASKFTGTPIGQTIKQTVNTLGSAALKAGENYMTQQVNSLSDPVRADLLTKANKLQNDLVVQIQMIDQGLQAGTIPGDQQEAYRQTKESYLEGLASLNQLIPILNTNLAGSQDALALLQQGPYLAQQTATALSKTAYASAANSLLTSVNSLNSSATGQTASVSATATASALEPPTTTLQSNAALTAVAAPATTKKTSSITSTTAKTSTAKTTTKAKNRY